MARYWEGTAQQFSFALLPEPAPTAEKIQQYRAASRRLQQLMAVKPAPKVEVDPTPRKEFIRIQRQHEYARRKRSARLLAPLKKSKDGRKTLRYSRNDDVINENRTAGSPSRDAETPDIRSRDDDLRTSQQTAILRKHRTVLFAQEEESMEPSHNVRQPAGKSHWTRSSMMARLRLSSVKNKNKMAKLREEEHNYCSRIHGLQIIERTRSDLLGMKKGMTASMCATFASKVWDACSIAQPIRAAIVREEERECLQMSRMRVLKHLPSLRVDRLSPNLEEENMYNVISSR